MQTTFVKKSKAAPPALFKPTIVNREILIPVDAIGGTNAAAMATPGSAAESFGRLKQCAAAIPENKAMSRSGILGSPRARISLVKSSRGDMIPHKKPISSAERKPRTIDFTELKINGRLPWTKAKPAARIGTIRGAISIAPITTAVLFDIKPNEAIAVERQINDIKSKFQLELTCRLL